MRTPEQIEELLDKVEALVNSYDEADKKFQDNQDKESWSSKYGERLSPYSDKLKVLNGDDFDIIEASRKEHKDSYPDLSDDDYVNALEENIKKVLNRVWPEADETKIQQVAEEVVSETKEPEAEAEAETETEADPMDDFIKSIESEKNRYTRKDE